MPVTIMNRWTGQPIATCEESDNIRDAVIKLTRKGVRLISADLRGSNLSGSNLRGSDLSGSNLRDSDLRDSDLRDSNLSGSNLRDSNLRGSNLSGSNLSGSNLSGSNLSGSNLRDSDLSGSNLSELIAVQSLHRKMLAAIEAGGTLDMRTWHTCETTHCRAGWAVHLAGPAGKVLECCYGPAVAGAIITRASLPQLDKVPNFYATNEEALADIRRCAEMEPAI